MTNHTTDTTTAIEGTTARLASWLAGFRADQAPAGVIERAKLLILDGLGCALVGAQLPWSRTAVEAVTGFEGRGEVPIIGWGRTAGGPAAAVLNSTFIQGFELDDFHPLAPLHSASLILPALLSSAHEDSSVDGARFLSAAIAGFEVGPRVGLALHGAQMLSRGWHSGPVFGSIAAAAAVANLLGLNATASEDALGLGATQAGGLMAAQFGAASKRMQHGFAARNGLYAALLARSGYTYPPLAKDMILTPPRSTPSWVCDGRLSASSSSPTRPWAACMPPSTRCSTSPPTACLRSARSRPSRWSWATPSTSTAGGHRSALSRRLQRR